MDERPCEGVRKDLKFCLQQSDCVRREKVKTVDLSETIAAYDLKVGRCRQLIEIMKDGHKPSECMKNHDIFPEECEKYRKTLWACKRSVFDMRQRFRGRKGY